MRFTRSLFPEVVHKVLHTTSKQGKPREPTVALLEIEYVPVDSANTAGYQRLSEWLSVPPDQLPPLRIKWSHLTRGPQGELWDSCRKVPDAHGTPYAPGGRLCRSNGYDYQSDSRQYVCGLPCPLHERERCPHGQKVHGYTHRMSFTEYPRLIGPIQRGTEHWKILYAARTASERTNRYDQEVLNNGCPPKLRGLKAFRFLGAIRTVAHLLRRALHFVLDVTYTLGKLPLART